MKLRKKVFLLAALTALTTFVIGGTAPIAQGHDPILHEPVHDGPPTCTWTVDKTASASTLTLALNQTITVNYKVVVTRTCEAGFDPRAEGGSANVIDSLQGTLAEHLFLESSNLHESREFTYSRQITGTHCGSFDVHNTVDVIDSDPTKPFATDTHTVRVTVNCDTGCTLTQGYWKTHSSYGPASKPDATWSEVGGPDATFFKSGTTWINVFWTAPAGNAYYQLAHQYMAAVLNTKNGASTPTSVTNAIATATNLFNTYTPAQIGALSGKDALRKQFVELAGILAAYNEGTTGPGHCDE